MSFFERWRSQHDADEWLRYMGFEERVIHGTRIYFNEHTGESLELFRPKQMYEKAIQKGVNLTEGVLERLAEKINELKLDDKTKKAFREFYMSEQNELNNVKKELDLKENK